MKLSHYMFYVSRKFLPQSAAGLMYRNAGLFSFNAGSIIIYIFLMVRTCMYFLLAAATVVAAGLPFPQD